MELTIADRGAVQVAREIVLEHGWNATCYQILNPGIHLWFSAAHRALVGYIRRDHVLLVAGAPVCAWDVLASVCEEFEAFACTEGCRVCYVCAEERVRALFARSSHHATIAVGAQPAWDPRTWPQIIQHRASLRAQLHRAANKGVVVGSVPAETAASDSNLRGVLRRWIKGRRLPPLHFLAEPNVLDGVMTDRMVLVGRRRDEPVGLLVASPIRARHGYQVELLAR